MKEDNYKDKYQNRFAQFYRSQYVITVGVGLIVLLGIWFWNQHQQAEDTSRRLIGMCFSECMGMFDEDKSILESNLNNPSIQEECMESCQKKYGQYK